ncbi:MAG: hypothetical protein FWD66_05035 [Paludibacter sp.]|nr:hypothetical protein [Paludibacter sp.]
MKKVILFFAVVASVAIFASCGPKQTDGQGTENDTTTVQQTVPQDTVPADTTTAVPAEAPAQ